MTEDQMALVFVVVAALSVIGVLIVAFLAGRGK